jgi:small-conductance mechanosensitive channel
VRGIDDEGTLSIVQRLTHYGVMALGVLVGLGIAQIDVTTIAAAGAVFAVVVGFAMQNISENFVSGLILMIERSIKQGDILEVDGSMVRIVSMGVRATVARTLDEEELIIPNSVMVKDTVKNYTLDDRMFRLHTRVGVSYDSDMRKVRLVLERAAREVPFRSPEHEPSVLMVEFGDSSVVWDVSIWMRNPWYEQGARSQLNEAIWFALKDAGITIAYPQLDLHVDAGTGALLRELPGRALS